VSNCGVAHLALAVWWLACALAAGYGVIALADLDGWWWLPTAAALVLGFAVLAAADRVKTVRDELYR
jgi:hypothetical protein